MRKLFFVSAVSLDGYFEGPDHDLSWTQADDEFHEWGIAQLKEADTHVYGRRTYQIMEDFWPKAAVDPAMPRELKEIASLLNGQEKVVYSRTLKEVLVSEHWKNTRLVPEFDPEEIVRLKERPGKSIMAEGPDLGVSLLKAGVVDELRLLVVPTMIGAGTTILRGLGSKFDFKLTKVRTFESGKVLLSYRPGQDGPKPA